MWREKGVSNWDDYPFVDNGKEHERVTLSNVPTYGSPWLLSPVVTKSRLRFAVLTLQAKWQPPNLPIAWFAWVAWKHFPKNKPSHYLRWESELTSHRLLSTGPEHCHTLLFQLYFNCSAGTEECKDLFACRCFRGMGGVIGVPGFFFSSERLRCSRQGKRPLIV